MTALNADITTVSMNMLKLAKIVDNRPIRDIVQEAIDKWLDSRGITPDKIPSPKPKTR